jgi:hypothetical protein
MHATSNADAYELLVTDYGVEPTVVDHEAIPQRIEPELTIRYAAVGWALDACRYCGGPLKLTDYQVITAKGLAHIDCRETAVMNPQPCAVGGCTGVAYLPFIRCSTCVDLGKCVGRVPVAFSSVRS